jgi:para-aminobenzoate synthetase
VAIGTAAGPGGEVLSYRVGEGAVAVFEPLTGAETRIEATILDLLRCRLAERQVEAASGGGGFGGGYVGYLGYELKADLGSPCTQRADTPDACLMFATRAVVFDPVGGTARAICIAPPQLPDADAEAALDEIAASLAALTETPAVPADPLPTGRIGAYMAPNRPVGTPEFGLSGGEYVAAVGAAQRALLEGESYEVCLTDAATVELDAPDPLSLYMRQRAAMPAPYGTLIRLGEVSLLSSSPERFLAVAADGAVESKPIKGTRPRGASAAEDAELREELAASGKDRAENMMVVDLVRNDLGRVCEVGSVTVPVLMAVESFSHVHQLVSTVRGRLEPGRDAIDCVESCFPAGSMTGAPKLRTMEIIDALEPAARGVYSGAHGYFGLDGSADLGVVIRSLVLRGNRAHLGGGGAVTVLSDPEAEHEEMLVKVEPLLSLLGAARAAVA